MGMSASSGDRRIARRDAPVRFIRRRGMLPLPVPRPGGSLDLLKDFLNLPPDDEKWILLFSWLTAAIAGVTPYCVLLLTGVQGTAKTSAARFLRRLVDPNQALVRTPPSKARDLMISADNSAMVALDNVSYLPAWLSDFLDARG